MKNKERVTFLLRENLGKLARDLRFLGYDASLYKSISFANAARIAEREGRIILSRSEGEFRRKRNCKVILIREIKSEKQLKELADLITYDPEQIFSRCSICNKKLYDIDKEKIIQLVNTYVLNAHEEFKICRNCGHIYWKGGHYRQIDERLKKIFEDGKK